jgi:methylenetetrahydrofolate dehydrogenase (NADP+)/methenyltetrahydrofolate cyclohydrolase
MKQDLLPRVETLRQHGVVPTLAILRVGNRPDDISYERTAIKRAESLNIDVRVVEFPENVSNEELEKGIQQVNENNEIHGCLMFRPLPEFLDEKALCDMLAPHKDVDGISTAALAGVFTDDPDSLPPSTAEACIKVLNHYGVSLAGKHVVVVGRSLVIGKPVSMMLLHHNASVTICHSKTENLAAITSAADIVICATGRARAFGAECFSAGQAVLDVGINFDAEGKMCGDVDFEAVEPLVAAITPVPGGIGSVTTSCTMEHTVAAAEKSLL